MKCTSYGCIDRDSSSRLLIVPSMRRVQGQMAPLPGQLQRRLLQLGAAPQGVSSGG